MSSRRGSKPQVTATPTKQHHSGMTPSNRTPSKSPISNTKCAHQSAQKQNVSYGQLQIVLQNLQNIKQKASTQVKLLNEQNSALRDEIGQLKSMLHELRQQIMVKDKEIKRVQEQSRQVVRDKDMEIKERDRALKEKDLIIDSFKKQQELSLKLSEQYDKLKQKWQWSFTILCGDPSQSQQTIYKIKSLNQTIPTLLQKHTSVTNLFQLSKQKIESLTHQLVQSKQQYKHTVTMLDKSLNELSTATSKISSLQGKVKEFSEFLVQSKENQILLEKQLEEGKTQREGLQRNIVDLEHNIQILSQQISSYKQIQREREEKQEYTSMVNQLCDQTEDYSRIIQRLQYLQRFRNQHYKNIEKIQYLCKTIDS